MTGDLLVCLPSTTRVYNRPSYRNCCNFSSDEQCCEPLARSDPNVGEREMYLQEESFKLFLLWDYFLEVR